MFWRPRQICRTATRLYINLACLCLSSAVRWSAGPLWPLVLSPQSLSPTSPVFLTPPLFSPASSWIFSERPNTKPVARTNQARLREAQVKKQQSAPLPASSKPAGGTAAAVRHRDGATGTKKASKAAAGAGKATTSTQAKTNPRGAYNSSRVIGKCGWTGGLACLSSAARCPACTCICLSRS